MKLTRRQFILAAAASFAPGVQAETPYLREGRLANGLSYKVLRQANARKTVMYMVYGSGCRHDPHDAQGTAHAVEHLMFRSQYTETGRPYDAEFKELGIDGKAFTTEDVTTYHCETPSSLLPCIFALEAARMRSITLSAAAFETEKNVVLAEIASKDASFQSNQRLTSAVMQGTTYTRSLAGIPEHIAALSLEAAIQFHTDHYAPANVALIVVGPDAPSAIEGWIYDAFGALDKPFLAQATHNQWKIELPTESVAVSGQPHGVLALAWPGPRTSENSLRDYWSKWSMRALSPDISATDLCFEHDGRFVLSVKRNSQPVAAQQAALRNAVHEAFKRTMSPQWQEGIRNSLELERRLQQHQPNDFAERLLETWLAERTPPPVRHASDWEQLHSLLRKSPQGYLL